MDISRPVIYMLNFSIDFRAVRVVRAVRAVRDQLVDLLAGHKYGDFNLEDLIYPLVMTNIAVENHNFHGKIHYKW